MRPKRQKRVTARREAATGVKLSDLTALLPGYNCRDCGYKSCYDFAQALAQKKAELLSCRFISEERFEDKCAEITAILGSDIPITKTEKIVGVLDAYVADFVLKPLPGECSCREVLFPFYRKEYKAGDLIKYRPLGCPLPHFARILEEDKGLITVHMIGPCHRMEKTSDMEFEDVGVCMVGGFVGIVEGDKPAVGQTVRFLPDGCMMQKIHSGVVVQIENDRAIIEGIDLKVWAPPEMIDDD